MAKRKDWAQTRRQKLHPRPIRSFHAQDCTSFKFGLTWQSLPPLWAWSAKKGRCEWSWKKNDGREIGCQKGADEHGQRGWKSRWMLRRACLGIFQPSCSLSPRTMPKVPRAHCNALRAKLQVWRKRCGNEVAFCNYHLLPFKEEVTKPKTAAPESDHQLLRSPRWTIKVKGITTKTIKTRGGRICKAPFQCCKSISCLRANSSIKSAVIKILRRWRKYLLPEWSLQERLFGRNGKAILPVIL